MICVIFVFVCCGLFDLVYKVGDWILLLFGLLLIYGFGNFGWVVFDGLMNEMMFVSELLGNICNIMSLLDLSIIGLKLVL